MKTEKKAGMYFVHCEEHNIKPYWEPVTELNAHIIARLMVEYRDSDVLQFFAEIHEDETILNKPENKRLKKRYNLMRKNKRANEIALAKAAEAHEGKKRQDTIASAIRLLAEKIMSSKKDKLHRHFFVRVNKPKPDAPTAQLWNSNLRGFDNKLFIIEEDCLDGTYLLKDNKKSYDWYFHRDWLTHVVGKVDTEEYTHFPPVCFGNLLPVTQCNGCEVNYECAISTHECKQTENSFLEDIKEEILKKEDSEFIKMADTEPVNPKKVTIGEIKEALAKPTNSLAKDFALLQKEKERVKKLKSEAPTQCPVEKDREQTTSVIESAVLAATEVEDTEVLLDNEFTENTEAKWVPVKPFLPYEFTCVFVNPKGLSYTIDFVDKLALLKWFRLPVNRGTIERGVVFLKNGKFCEVGEVMEMPPVVNKMIPYWELRPEPKK